MDNNTTQDVRSSPFPGHTEIRGRLTWIILALCTLFYPPVASYAGPIPLNDEELADVEGMGLYFRVDLGFEVFTPGSNTPQVVLNTGTPIVLPTPDTGTDGSLQSLGSAGGPITLSDNAQSNINSLINVIGSGSVINIGVNVVSITNSSNDTIFTTNLNNGVMQKGGEIPPSLPLNLLP